MKVSKALEGILLNRIHGADVPDIFKNMCLGDYQALMSWIIEIENAEDQHIEIDMRHAPQWFVDLVRGNKINAIKEVRSQLPHVVTYELNIPKEGYTFHPNLKPTKDFVEAMQECIVAPSRPLLTSA